MRIGSGVEGSDLDYNNLKSHPFFKDIDFANLQKTEIPINKRLLDLNLETKDENKDEAKEEE
jgi:hypothetical protein